MLVGGLVQVVPQLLALVSQLEGRDCQGRGEFLISHSGSGSGEGAGDRPAGGLDGAGVGPLVSLVIRRRVGSAQYAGHLSVQLGGRLVAPALRRGHLTGSLVRHEVRHCVLTSLQCVACSADLSAVTGVQWELYDNC